MEPLLTVAQVAEILGRQPRMVRSLIQQGRLRAVDITVRTNAKARRYGIRKDAVDEFLAANSTRPPAKANRRKPASPNTGPRYV